MVNFTGLQQEKTKKKKSVHDCSASRRVLLFCGYFEFRFLRCCDFLSFPLLSLVDTGSQSHQGLFLNPGSSGRFSLCSLRVPTIFSCSLCFFWVFFLLLAVLCVCFVYFPKQLNLVDLALLVCFFCPNMSGDLFFCVFVSFFGGQ